MPRVTADHEAARPRAHRPRRDRGLRRERLPPGHDRRHRRAGRPVGRGDLHPLHEQGELFLASCDLITDQEIEELARAARAARPRPRPAARRDRLLRRDRSTSSTAAPGQAAARRSPGPRRTTSPGRPRDAPPAPRAARRGGQLLLQEGIARGELPAWLDIDGFARGFMGLLDGLILQRIEAGAALPAGTISIRRATPSSTCCCRRQPSDPESRRRSIAGHGPRPDRPRPDRPGRPRVRRCPTSTPRSRCGTSRTAGTTGS